jgi:AraC-like DNA-binding protein
VRLRRVLDYISDHIADEVTVEELARVACLSTFHFARMFRLTIGVSPHRYVSRLRLENAMAEIAAGRRRGPNLSGTHTRFWSTKMPIVTADIPVSIKIALDKEIARVGGDEST